MADKLVHTGYCNGNKSAPIKVYVSYSSTQNISSNKSIVTCGMWIEIAKGWNIGSWSDVGGSYVGRTNLTFNGTIPYCSGKRTLVSGKTFEVSHNNDGTASTTIYWKWGVNSSWGKVQKPSGSFNISLPTIPRKANISSAPNFNDEENPTITYNNNAGNAVSNLDACISFTGSKDDIPYRPISKTGTTYTFNLTEEERNILRNATTTSNTRNVIFYIRTVIGGNTFYSTVTKTLSIINANPTFLNSQLSYLDSNSSIVEITGNNQHIVQNRSNLQVAFTSATAKKGASISRYEISFNGSTQNKNVASTINYGTVNLSSDSAVVVKAVDSRGNSTTISKTITILAWVLPTAVITAYRINNYEDETNIKADVSISSVNSKNDIKSIKYRYKKTSDSSFSSYVSIENNTMYQVVIDKLYAWNFQIVIQDKFGTTTYNFVIAKGVPIMFIDVDKLSVGVDCFPSKNNTFEADGIAISKNYAVGSIMITDSNTNPGTSMGGTWSLLTSQTINGTTIYYWKRTA